MVLLHVWEIFAQSVLKWCHPRERLEMSDQGKPNLREGLGERRSLHSEPWRGVEVKRRSPLLSRCFPLPHLTRPDR